MKHTVLVLFLAGAIASPAQTFVCGNSRTGATPLAASSIYSATTPGFDLQTLPQIDAKSCSGEKPFFFSVALPEGSYRITVTLGGAQPSTTTVWAEARRLMLEKVAVKANGSVTRKFDVNVRVPVIDGDASLRCGISLKGADIVVGGSVGSFSAFMAQAGRIVVCGDAEDALGDSLYEAVIYVRGKVRSLGADARFEPMTDADRLAVFQKQERRQRAARLDAPGGHQLRRLEDVDRRKVAVPRLAFVDIGQSGVGGAEVDADFHATLLFDLDFGGRDDAGVLFSGQCGKIHLRRAPTFMAQGAAGGRRGRNVADEPDEVRVARGRLDGRAFDAVNHRLECDIAREGVAALVVKLAHRRAHLVVGV